MLLFIRPSRESPYYVIGYGGRVSTQVSHNNFSSVYQIFTKLGHMIPLWKGKNPIYVEVKGQGHLLLIEFLTTGSFPHDNFSSVY